MRLFASDRIASLMDRMGFEEGDALENKMLSNSVERAQKKVEENNFGIRKRLLEYDDVMNSQRKGIYEKRRHALMGERIGMDVLNMLYDVTEAIVNKNKEADDYEGFRNELLSVLAVETEFTPEAFKSSHTNEVVDKTFETVYQALNHKGEKIATVAYPILHNLYETQGDKFKRIIIPITDGNKVYNIPCDLAEADRTEGKSIVKEFHKTIMLYTLDDAWKEHLREMDELRNSVQNASYENKDPLLIYKLESYDLFSDMLDGLNRKTATILTRGRIPLPADDETGSSLSVREAQAERRTDRSQYRETKDEIASQQEAQRQAGQAATQASQPKAQPIVKDKKIGRNDPCPCGSGKKYKNCHGRNA